MILPSRRVAGISALGFASFFPVLSLGRAQAQIRPPSQDATAGRTLPSIQKLFEQNRTAEALDAAGKFERENSEHPEALNLLAGLLALHSQHERAAALFFRINELRPHSAEVLYNLGIAL